MVLFEIHQKFKSHFFNKLRITFNLQVRYKEFHCKADSFSHDLCLKDIKIIKNI